MKVLLNNVINNSCVNYLIKGVSEPAVRVIHASGNIKKICQLVIKIVAAIDLHSKGVIVDRRVIFIMKDVVYFIGFYGTYKNLTSLYQNVRGISLNKRKIIGFFSKRGNKTITKIDQVGEILSKPLVQKQKQARSPVLLLSTICFTITGLAENIQVLKKWDIADLSKLASSIGGRSRVFATITRFGVDKAMEIIAGIGSIVVIGETTHRLIKQTIYYAQDKDAESREARRKEIRGTMIEFLVNGTDFVSTVSPILFTLTPLSIVMLSIVAKGTGLICAFVRLN